MAKKITHEEWFNKYKNRIDPSLEILSQYSGTRNKMKVRCKLCGKIYYTLPSVLISGCKCKHCSSIKSNEKFVKELKEINDMILPLESYISDNAPIMVKCLVCGCEWRARPTHLLRNHGCPSCGRRITGLKRRKNLDEFILNLKESNPMIEYVSGFSGMHVKATFKSKICNHIWEATPNNILYGKCGCPYCSMSHGEVSIYNYLTNNNIFFETQKTYNDLLGVRDGNLSYDFYLPDYNLLIEFQGKQHEKPTTLPFSHSIWKTPEEQFKVQQEHDRRKREYAKEHNISLLEIWYWDFDNVEQILSEKLNINSNKKSA